MAITITNDTNTKVPDHPYEQMVAAVLGKDYDLSLVFVDDATIATLNKQYRDKDMPTDILSFPLSDTAGEIFISPEATKKEMLKFDREYENFVAFLFIHGLWHLKGFDHSSTMESNEQKTRVDFGI
jgi:probable rRNA maturation factor